MLLFGGRDDGRTPDTSDGTGLAEALPVEIPYLLCFSSDNCLALPPLTCQVSGTITEIGGVEGDTSLAGGGRGGHFFKGEHLARPAGAAADPDPLSPVKREGPLMSADVAPRGV